jgi:thiol-disulfide isomerase/thioredoxin
VIEFTLYSRSYCHLCDDMLDALRALIAAHGASAKVEVMDVDADPALVERYDELVPVLLASKNGAPAVQVCHYFLDHAAVAALLAR